MIIRICRTKISFIFTWNGKDHAFIVFACIKISWLWYRQFGRIYYKMDTFCWTHFGYDGTCEVQVTDLIYPRSTCVNHKFSFDFNDLICQQITRTNTRNLSVCIDKINHFHLAYGLGTVFHSFFDVINHQAGIVVTVVKIDSSPLQTFFLDEWLAAQDFFW